MACISQKGLSCADLVSYPGRLFYEWSGYEASADLLLKAHDEMTSPVPYGGYPDSLAHTS